MARPPAVIEEIGAAFPDFDQERDATLRQLALKDPIAGAPMLIQVLPGGKLEPIEPGQWSNKGLGDHRTGLPPACPVTPLGKDAATCFFLDTQGAVAELEARSSGKGPIGYIFGGRSRYLEWAWPRWGKGKAIAGWDADNARQALVDACSYVGYFAIEDQVRGRGAWRDDDGALIYHAGDEIWIDGRWRACGVHGRHIYPARPKIGRPARRARPADELSSGRVLLELFSSFTWEREQLDPRLLLGWLVTAKIGGALDRRPVAFVAGAEGSGKSTLQAMMREVMIGALIKTSNTTQAGIYQRLQQDSIAIMIDEMEPKEDTRTVDKILELARISYSGDKMQRGGQHGVAKEFALNSSFLGSSISKPATDAQDDSRMVVLNLRKRTPGGKPTVERRQLEEIGRDLLRRIFDWWPKWDRLVDGFRDLMIELGHTDRAADTFAPLCAGYHLATSDEMPDAGALDEWRTLLPPLELAETAAREETWQRCFWLLMDAQPEVLRTRHHRSIGAAVAEWRDAEAREPGSGATSQLHSLEEVLTICGLALSFPKGFDTQFDHARLFVPFKSPGLHALFDGSPWAGRQGAPGPWGGVLRQAPRELWTASVCDKGLNRAARGLMISLKAALEETAS